jgi:hypothetical protein
MSFSSCWIVAPESVAASFLALDNSEKRAITAPSTRAVDVFTPKQFIHPPKPFELQETERKNMLPINFFVACWKLQFFSAFSAVKSF